MGDVKLGHTTEQKIEKCNKHNEWWGRGARKKLKEKFKKKSTVGLEQVTQIGKHKACVAILCHVASSTNSSPPVQSQPGFQTPF